MVESTWAADETHKEEANKANDEIKDRTIPIKHKLNQINKSKTVSREWQRDSYKVTFSPSKEKNNDVTNTPKLYLLSAGYKNIF